MLCRNAVVCADLCVCDKGVHNKRIFDDDDDDDYDDPF